VSRKTKFKVDIKGFGAVISSLSKLSGAGFKKTMKAEVGHILHASIRRTPIASTKKIVGRTMPEGYKVKGLTGEGKRLVTHYKGHIFHAGKLIRASDGVRGGFQYRRPNTITYPGQRWMNKPIKGGGSTQEWEVFVEEQRKKTLERNAKKGLSAGVFYAMAKKGKIVFPKTPKGNKFISSNEVQKMVRKYVNVNEVGQNYSYSLLVESKNLNVAKYNKLQNKLLLSTSGRIKYFYKNMQKGFTDEFKRLMPKKYPLIMQ
jgi:hypothetical protein